MSKHHEWQVGRDGAPLAKVETPSGFGIVALPEYHWTCRSHDGKLGQTGVARTAIEARRNVAACLRDMAHRPSQFKRSGGWHWADRQDEFGRRDRLR